MTADLYYTPPKEEEFEELKKEAIALWSTMGDEPSYRREKIGRIKNIPNVGDNFMFMLAMFDMGNQRKIIKNLSEATKAAIKERMIAGGSGESYLELVFGL